MGKSTWKDRSEKTDEHNLPTEPLPPLVLAPPQAPIVLPAVPGGVVGSPPYEHEHTYPQPYMPTAAAAPFYPYSQNPPLIGTYPYLPPAPLGQQSGREQSPVQSARPTGTSSRTHNRAIPFFVGFGFVIIQLLLLVRFCSKVINLSDNLSWTGPVYAISDVFVAPFHILIQPYTGGIPTNIELYTLLAVVVYGLGSRLLVRFLKVLF